MDHSIDEMETLRLVNEQKVFEIQRTNGQLNKALEVSGVNVDESLPGPFLSIQTVKQTVDMKDKLESDLYRKVQQSICIRMCSRVELRRDTCRQQRLVLLLLAFELMLSRRFRMFLSICRSTSSIGVIFERKSFEIFSINDG